MVRLYSVWASSQTIELTAEEQIFISLNVKMNFGNMKQLSHKYCVVE